MVFNLVNNTVRLPLVKEVKEDVMETTKQGRIF